MKENTTTTPAITRTDAFVNLFCAIVGEPHDELRNNDLSQFQMDELLMVLHSLTPREERVLRIRFGLDDGIRQNLEQVGKEFNVTRERVRQIEAKALRKLRHPWRTNRFRYILRAMPSDEYGLYDLAFKISRHQIAMPDDLHSVIVEALDLSLSANNILHRVGLTTIGQLTEVSYEEFLAMHRCAGDFAEEIVKALAAYELSFRK